MQYNGFLIALLCLPLAACVQQHIGNITPNITAFSPTVQEKHGIIVEVKSCSLNQDVAVCSLTATSKNQNRNLNLIGGSYTKLQDDTGLSYPVFMAFGPDAKDKSQRSSRLIANTPYPFLLQAENMSTQATKVRAIDIIRMDVSGVGPLQYLNMTFSNPPMRDITHHQQAIAVPPGHVELNVITPSSQEKLAKKHLDDNLFARIVPINDQIAVDPGLKSLWEKGAYIHLHPNGKLGHNWSKAGTYAYVPGQYWNTNGKILTIAFGPDLTYTFVLSQDGTAMTTFSDQGGAIKMTLYPKH